jgi:hypothetical protein
VKEGADGGGLMTGNELLRLISEGTLFLAP